MNIEKLIRSTVFVVGIPGLFCLLIGEFFNILVLRKVGIYIGISVAVLAVSIFFAAIVASFVSDWRNR
jgi:hypothetical protein